MQEAGGKEDVPGISSRPSSARGLKHTASGRSTPRHSPWKPRPPQRGGGAKSLVLWLSLIAFWAYLGFLIQSLWAHDNGGAPEFAAGHGSGASHDPAGSRGDLAIRAALESSDSVRGGGVSLARRRDLRNDSRGSGGRSARGAPERRVARGGKVPRSNTSYGLLVGPFGVVEDRVLGWTAEKRKGACDRGSGFAELVRSRSFVLVFHELSMTGAPISMLELATEILSCGGTVSAVALSWKGGLMAELSRRGIRLLRDKGRYSFRAASRADLVVAGSAVCSSWIEEYLSYFSSRSNRVVWWIMENRREYFDRSKHVLNQVKVLMFLAETQSKQWLQWCKEEGIHLRMQPTVIPLSVNDELAFVAGIPCPLNDPSFTVEKMQEKRKLLRIEVRREMGLTDNDMLVMSLSSINPGKGQSFLLQSIYAFEQMHSAGDIIVNDIAAENNKSTVIKQKIYPETLSEKVDQFTRVLEDDLTRKNNVQLPHKQKRRAVNLRSRNSNRPDRKEYSRGTRNLLEYEINKKTAIKLLIGSVGSKSNKVPYMKEMLSFISKHPDLSRVLLWTPATTRVSSLYAAADVYIMNAQGIGETFGRVTIEAMAFGLPILGTDAGGTKEIVESNITGLLHPVGYEGSKVLAQNLNFLLTNSSAREQLGINGRLKVEKMYLKHHMYRKLAVVFAKCMKR